MTTLPARTPEHRTLLATGIGGAALAIVVATSGFVWRAHQLRGNAQWAQAQSVPTVSLAKIQTGQASHTDLPATVQPFQKAQIYARVSGYLKSWQVDIGAPVRAGQTLAVVDAPDLDQQLAQARGDLGVARANARLADLTAQRWKALQATGAVSQQVIDEKAGESDAKRAAVNAALGRLRSIEALAAYKRITSPFDGIVTARKTDIGALIDAGSNGKELFEISDLSRLRIYAQVPQVLASRLTVGQQVDVTLPETPGQTGHATITAISHALDPRTRTMLIQLQAPNPAGAIGAGAYCTLTFQQTGVAGAMRIPATALVSSDAGSQVAVLGPGDVVRIVRVQLGRDYGNAVDVVAGLMPGDRVIDSPPETLRNGDHVRLSTGA
jgi:RND family efflux transporter MFP subunit